MAEFDLVSSSTIRTVRKARLNAMTFQLTLLSFLVLIISWLANGFVSEGKQSITLLTGSLLGLVFLGGLAVIIVTSCLKHHIKCPACAAKITSLHRLAQHGHCPACKRVIVSGHS